MKYDVPDLKATANIRFLGLAACCRCKGYKDAKAPNRNVRWDVALPRYDPEHFLRISIRTDQADISIVSGVKSIDFEADHIDPSKQRAVCELSSSVRIIEVKDSGGGVQVDNPQFTADGSQWERVDKNSADPKDFRWIADFPQATGINTNLQPGSVTLAYVYDATFYSDLSSDANRILRLPQTLSGPVLKGAVHRVPDYIVGPVLDTADRWGYESSAIVADIHSPDNGGSVDILIDGKVLATIRRQPGDGAPPVAEIINAERPAQNDSAVTGNGSPRDDSVITREHSYGRGDHYLYYKMFAIAPGTLPNHTWEEKPPPVVDEPRGRVGDCDGISVDLLFHNLDGFLSQSS